VILVASGGGVDRQLAAGGGAVGGEALREDAESRTV
jgi:hypothetical protein